jgi:hypothetical protein
LWTLSNGFAFADPLDDSGEDSLAEPGRSALKHSKRERRKLEDISGTEELLIQSRAG